jgi:hypothetical protein
MLRLQLLFNLAGVKRWQKKRERRECAQKKKMKLQSRITTTKSGVVRRK